MKEPWPVLEKISRSGFGEKDKKIHSAANEKCVLRISCVNLCASKVRGAKHKGKVTLRKDAAAEVRKSSRSSCLRRREESSEWGKR